MKKFFFGLLFIISLTKVDAQYYRFDRTIRYNQVISYDLCQLPDSNFVIGSMSYDSDSTNQNLSLQQNLFSRTGHLISVKNYTPDSLSAIGKSIIADRKNCLTLATVYLTNPSDGFIALVKTDSGGNVLWSKKYQSNFYSADAVNLTLSPDHGFLICYQTNTAAIGLLKIDSLGTIIWDKKISSSAQYQNGRAVKYTDDGNIIVVGNEFAISNDHKPKITKLDSNGNILWSKLYQFPYGLWPADFILDKKGDIYLSGTYLQSIGAHNFFDIVFKMDSAGNFIWGNIISGDWGVAEGFSLATTRDSGIVVVMEIENFYVVSQSVTGLIKFDENGNQIWSRIYNYLSPIFPSWKMISCLDGGFAIPGYVLQSPSSLTLIKTDDDGHTDCDSTITTVLSPVSPISIDTSVFTSNGSLFAGEILFIENNFTRNDSLICEGIYYPNGFEMQEENEFSEFIFPNPANSSITIDNLKSGSKIILSDLSGRILLSQKAADKKIILDISSLPQSIYLIRINEKVFKEVKI